MKLRGFIDLEPEGPARLRPSRGGGWIMGSTYGAFGVVVSEQYLRELRDAIDAELQDEWAPYYSDVFADERPAPVDAFVNLRQRPARAIARGDWVDVGDHDFRQVTNKTHGHPVSLFTVGLGDDQHTYAWSNDSVRTIADRVTDCEGNVMPEPSDSWDVV